MHPQPIKLCNGLAVLEILVACRSDKALAERFVPEHERVQFEASAKTAELLAEMGLSDKFDAWAPNRYSEACARSLVIDRVFNDDLNEMPHSLVIARTEIVAICAMAEAA